MISISYRVPQIPLRQVRSKQLPSYSPQRSIQVTGFGDNQFLKAVTGGIRTVHFGYQTSGIKGARVVTGDGRIRKNAHDGDETGM
ncbi:MAG: hypothetical protein ACLUJR_03290 [Mediterraneibacter gnavus]